VVRLLQEAELSACVLVVDDDPLVRFATVQILADAGFEIIEAEDAAEALAILKSHDQGIDVLVTDVRMPGRMNGFELSSVAKRKWPELRVIVTSGFFDRAGVYNADIAVRRWQAATGRDATHVDSGLTFEELHRLRTDNTCARIASRFVQP
jgi:CheY-like chemotaxis protein